MNSFTELCADNMALLICHCRRISRSWDFVSKVPHKLLRTPNSQLRGCYCCCLVLAISPWIIAIQFWLEPVVVGAHFDDIRWKALPRFQVFTGTKATLTLNSYEKGGDGGAPSECDNQCHSGDTPVVATGCLLVIPTMITSLLVLTTLLMPRKQVWKALGVPESEWGEMDNYSKKRPLDNYSPLQECSYFKMRAVVKDIRPHVLEWTSGVARELRNLKKFTSCGMIANTRIRLEIYMLYLSLSCSCSPLLSYDNICSLFYLKLYLKLLHNSYGKELKLLMELYKQMTEEKVTVTKWKIPPNSSENGVGLKPQEQLQETADQSQPGQVFAKPSEKLQAEHGENQGTHIVGGSAFGWNFITFPGSKPIYYGRTKELFRAAQVTL
ncbi:hypothetical protein DKX38_020932 [Salix brachista]|uniref:Uncharacterized protein n=1 Tax=Salix brachista TaxID=2182728 RepID=A0A5N5KBH3_9ROSI|nr:hypothetical protein DKX38_020932 [Salix brachista]